MRTEVAFEACMICDPVEADERGVADGVECRVEDGLWRRHDGLRGWWYVKRLGQAEFFGER